MAGLALALCGCAGSPVPTYFVLGATMPAVAPVAAGAAGGANAAGAPAPTATDAGPDRVVIVLDELHLPEWLDRPQMTLQASAGRLRVDADHRWGEPLAAGVERLIAAQLRTARPGAWVALARSGGTPTPPGWRIAVVIDAVQARPGGSLSAWVRWQRLPMGEPPGRQPVIDQAVFDTPLADTSPEALVNAWTRLSDALGLRIATGW
jgi:uncharacterized lipoprotein YmbA